MKNTLLVLTAILLYFTVSAQFDQSKKPAVTNDSPLTYSDYQLFKHFVFTATQEFPELSLKNIVSTDTKFYADRLNQQLQLDRKKEFVPVLLIDERFVSHSLPVPYSVQNYQWIPPKNTSLNLAAELISAAAGTYLESRYQIRLDKEKGYYTPVGLKY